MEHCASFEYQRATLKTAPNANERTIVRANPPCHCLSLLKTRPTTPPAARARLRIPGSSQIHIYDATMVQLSPPDHDVTRWSRGGEVKGHDENGPLAGLLPRFTKLMEFQIFY